MEISCITCKNFICNNMQCKIGTYTTSKGVCSMHSTLVTTNGLSYCGIKGGYNWRDCIEQLCVVIVNLNIRIENLEGECSKKKN